MEFLPILLSIIISALIAQLGKKRNIGAGWSFVFCLFLTPIIGLIITLLSKKKDVEFINMSK